METNVLIVDDDPFIRDVLVDAFSREPWRILSAGSAGEALEILEEESVDVVISDELMPGMNGSEFLAVVRKKYPHTIRMILTGHASLESAIKSINEGEIYRFFTKPCNVVDLIVTVRQALQHRGVVKGSQKLVTFARRQSEFIEGLEKAHPGITKVKRDEEGAVILDDGSGRNTENPIEEIDSLLQEYGNFFPDKS